MKGAWLLLLGALFACHHDASPPSGETAQGTQDTSDPQDSSVPALVCPPDADTTPVGTTNDGRPKFRYYFTNNPDATGATNPAEVVAWLLCCEPSWVYVEQDLGAYQLDIHGVVNSTCHVDVTTWGDLPVGDPPVYTCDLPMPIDPWPGLYDTNDPPDPSEDPHCTMMESAG